jgi:ligand-binding SRPBCC domain-containing protein
MTMPNRVQFEHWIEAPLEQVFRFFANPQNLPRLMPPWMRVRLDDVNIVPPPDLSAKTFAGVGSMLRASYRVMPFLPFRISSVARITAFKANHYFEDTQEEGPFKSWHHRHEFVARPRENASGTLIRDIIEYHPGLGILGAIANRLFLAPQIARTFAHRQQALDKLLQSGELARL